METVLGWDCKRVQQWLASAELPDDHRIAAAAAFVENDIDGFALASLANANSDAINTMNSNTLDLLRSQLGLVSYGLRLKLAAAIARLFAETSSPSQDSSFPISVLFVHPPLNIQTEQTQSIQFDSRNNCATAQYSPKEFRHFFLSSNNVDWKSTAIADHPLKFSANRLLNLYRNSQIRDFVGDENFFFKRSRKYKVPSSVLTVRKRVQKQLKQMFSNWNLTIFDKDTINQNPAIFEFVSRLNETSLLAIWQVPTAMDEIVKRATVRVFRRVGHGNEISDFVDNSGKYDLMNGFYLNSLLAKSQINTKNERNSELLPIYGESDSENYETDSEWERELKENERQKLLSSKDFAKRQQENLIDRNSDAAKNNFINIDDSEINLDILALVDNDNVFVRNPTSKSNQKQESDSFIHSRIAYCIELFEKEWRTKLFPKIAQDAFKIYKNRDTYADKYKSELDDITNRLLPNMTTEIVLVCRRDIKNPLVDHPISEKIVGKACENIRTIIHNRMELEWKCGIVNSDEPLYIVKPISQTKKETTAKKGMENAHSDWSDFSASDDDFQNNIIQNQRIVHLDDVSDEEKISVSSTNASAEIPAKKILQQKDESIDTTRIITIDKDDPPKTKEISPKNDYNAQKSQRSTSIPSVSVKKKVFDLISKLSEYYYPDSPEPPFPIDFDFSAADIQKYAAYQPFVVYSQSNVIDFRLDESKNTERDYSLLTDNLEDVFERWYPDPNSPVTSDAASDREFSEQHKRNSKLNSGGNYLKRLAECEIELVEYSDGQDDEDTVADDFWNSGLTSRRNLNSSGSESQIVKNILKKHKTHQVEGSNRVRKHDLDLWSEKVIINLGHADNETPIYIDEFLACKLMPHQTFMYTLQREVRLNNPHLPEHIK
ncbi:hypothetical protein HK100_001662, partial [Physocladia obscura]